jgi:release factor glutamine methyltransferase
VTQGRDLLDRAAARLAEAGVGSPRFDAETLLAHVLGTSRLGARLVAEISDTDRKAFDALLERRARREPLQHLTGEAPFRHLVLAVGPGVFVPRPETEVVAGWAIEAAAASSERPVVVDLCTGSGAIALAVATELPRARVYACEQDPAAYEWAERNLTLAPGRVRLELGDAADAFAELDGSVDVVVSNPPYIPLQAWESVEPEVRDHDPGMALWSGQDGLDAIRMVERTAARLLRPGGHVVVEHADLQGEIAPAVFRRTGNWTEASDHTDLSGKPRFVTATRARSVRAAGPRSWDNAP